MDSQAMESILYRLKIFFDPYIKTSLADWRALASYLTIEQLKNRAMVKSAGNKEQFLRFILDGASAMLMRQEAKNVCFDLCFEDDFLADFESLHSGQPSNIFIKTFEPVRAVVIDRPRLLKIYSISPLGAQLGRVLAEQQNRRSQMNNIEYLGRTTEERYRKLMLDRPRLLLRTPQHYLASYLGVSTENLSRIRKKIGNK